MDYTDIPALPPPVGVQSNFTNPKTLGTSLIVVNTVFLPLMLLVVAIRIYSRGHIMHRLGWDDYTCITAADIIALAIVYPIVIFFVKLSISLLYIRLFGVQRTFRYLVYFGIIFCFSFYTAYMGTQIATAVLCVSHASSTRLHPICTNGDVLTVFTGVGNVLTDFYLLVLPIPLVMHLKLKNQQRMGLLCIFMAGLVACLVSLARLIYASSRLHDKDTLYNAALTSELTSVELNVGIITASMPAVPTFFGKSRIFKSSTYSSLRAFIFASRTTTQGKPSTANYVSKGSKASNSAAAAEAGVSGHGYLELEEVSRFRLSNGQGTCNTNDISSEGNSKTVSYGDR